MKKNILVVGFLLLILFVAQSQGKRITKLEFRDRPVADILLALGEAGQLSIVPDATVTGNASYYFSDMDAEEALRKFAAAFNLYMSRKDGVIYVSRVDARFDPASGLASLHAEDVRLSQVLRAFSKALGRTILKDEIPDRPVSVHAEGMIPATVAGILAKSFPEVSLEVSEDFLYFHRVEAGKTATAGQARPRSLVKGAQGYSLEAHRLSFLDLVTEIFSSAGKDYSLLTKGDTVIDGLSFKDRSFDDALGLILEQANADYAIAGNTYYVFDIQRKDVLKKLKATVAIPVDNYPVSDLVNLFPPDFSSSGMIRLDKQSNTLYLSGSIEEIKPVQDFIKQLDMPPSGRSYVRFSLRHLKAKDILALLPTRFSSLSPLALPDGSGFIVMISEMARADLQGYLDLVDRESTSSPIRLRYIKSEDLLKNLPPSVSKENIVDGGNGSVLFFNGSEEKKRAFLEDLSVLDRPKAQIRYDILVVQYTVGDNLDYSESLKVSQSTSSSTSPLAFAAELSKLLSLKFDIVSELGYLFSATLDANLTNDRAQIFADTTLYGVVGKDLKFQNTTTYRYKDTVSDSSGNTTSSVTREVSSGLILSLNGWASGDGMITVDISATASERTDSASGSTTAPTTSERVISTSVHTPSGTPIAIGGLRQQKTETVIKKTPLLGDIPLLGKVFQSRVDKASDTEIVIYLVPYVMLDGVADGSQAFELERIYADFVKGY